MRPTTEDRKRGRAWAEANVRIYGEDDELEVMAAANGYAHAVARERARRVPATAGLADLEDLLAEFKRLHAMLLSPAPMTEAVELDERESFVALKTVAKITRIGLAVLMDGGFKNDDALEAAHDFIDDEIVPFLEKQP